MKDIDINIKKILDEYLGFKLNDDNNLVEIMKESLTNIKDKFGEFYCPCKVDKSNPDNICPCKDFRDGSICHCKLFIKEK